jgi:hypothetical protein
MRNRLNALVRARLEGGSVAWRAVARLLHDHLAIARARHGTWVAPEVFANHALDHLSGETGAGTALVSRLSALHSADLYLALAAADGVSPAVARVDAEHVEPICKLMSRPGKRAVDDDVLGRLRSRLRGSARLRSYTGRCSLRDWLRVTAARDLRDLRRVTSPSCRDPSSASARRVRAAAPSSAASSR